MKDEKETKEVKTTKGFYPDGLRQVKDDQFSLPTWFMVCFLIVCFIIFKSFIYIKDVKRDNS